MKSSPVMTSEKVMDSLRTLTFYRLGDGLLCAMGETVFLAPREKDSLLARYPEHVREGIEVHEKGHRPQLASLSIGYNITKHGFMTDIRLNVSGASLGLIPTRKENESILRCFHPCIEFSDGDPFAYLSGIKSQEPGGAILVWKLGDHPNKRRT